MKDLVEMDKNKQAINPIVLKRGFLIDFKRINWVEIKFKSVKKITLLIVDDERSFRELLLDIFETEGGYEVDLAENGQEGYEKFKEKRHDIVLTDIMMDVMTGVEMAEYIRRLNPDQKIFFFSGWLSTNRLIEKFPDEFEREIFQFIDKPFNITKFQNRIYLFKNKNISQLKINTLDLDELADKTKDLNEGQLFALHKNMWNLIHKLYQRLLGQKIDEYLFDIQEITDPAKLITEIILDEKGQLQFKTNKKNSVKEKLKADIWNMAYFLKSIYDEYCKNYH